MITQVEQRERKGLDELFPPMEDVANEDERKLAALEPAWGKAALFFRTGHRSGHSRDSVRCMSLSEVQRMLEVYRNRFRTGDTLSLLQAISMCAEENLPLPQWLAEEFRARMTSFGQPGPLHSLDGIFSSSAIPTTPPKKAATARLDWQLGSRLCHEVWLLAQRDEALTSFDSAVERLLASSRYGVGKTKAKALITMIEKSQSQFLGKDLSLSRFLTKRRKLMK